MNVRLVLFPLLLVLAFGCKSKPSLVGTWDGTLTVMMTAVQVEFQFGEDGKLTYTQSVMGKSSSTKGDYKAGEKTIMYSPTSIDATGLTKAQLDQLNAQFAASKKSITFDLVWKDNDMITLSQQGAQPPANQAFELKRKKS